MLTLFSLGVKQKVLALTPNISIFVKAKVDFLKGEVSREFEFQNSKLFVCQQKQKNNCLVFFFIYIYKL